MKAFALPLIAGALSLYGSAFFDVWTAPGLENLPTYEVVKHHLPWEEAEEVVEKPKSEIIPLSASTQFRPHGVNGNWSAASLIALPERTQLEAPTKPHPLMVAKKPVRSKRATTPTPPAAKPDEMFKKRQSYTLAGSNNRPQRTSRGRGTNFRPGPPSRYASSRARSSGTRTDFRRRVSARHRNGIRS